MIKLKAENMKLPLEYPAEEMLRIYRRRLLVFSGVIIGNLVLLAVLMLTWVFPRVLLLVLGMVAVVEFVLLARARRERTVYEFWRTDSPERAELMSRALALLRSKRPMESAEYACSSLLSEMEKMQHEFRKMTIKRTIRWLTVLMLSGSLCATSIAFVVLCIVQPVRAEAVSAALEIACWILAPLAAGALGFYWGRSPKG